MPDKEGWHLAPFVGKDGVRYRWHDCSTADAALVVDNPDARRAHLKECRARKDSRARARDAQVSPGSPPEEQTLLATRKEPSVATTTKPKPAEAKPASPAKATPAPAAAPDAAVRTDLFDALIAEVKTLDPAVQIVEKSAYARVGLGGERGKTLMYVNHPTSKGVRVEIPDADGGYDIRKVTDKKGVDRAVVAVKKRVASL